MALLLPGHTPDSLEPVTCGGAGAANAGRTRAMLDKMVAVFILSDTNKTDIEKLLLR